jgi:hypothetical protein
MDVFKWLKMGSFERTFQFWEKKKSREVRSGEYGAWVICFVAKRWRILWSHFGTHFPHVQICLTLSVAISNPSTLIMIPKLRSVLTWVLTFSTFSSVFIVTERPGRSSSASPLLSDHFLWHWNIEAVDKAFSPCALRKKLNPSVAVLFNFTINLILTSGSILSSYEHGKLKKSFIKIITGSYVIVTQRGVAHDWDRIRVTL